MKRSTADASKNGAPMCILVIKFCKSELLYENFDLEKGVQGVPYRIITTNSIAIIVYIIS